MNGWGDHPRTTIGTTWSAKQLDAGCAFSMNPKLSNGHPLAVYASYLWKKSEMPSRTSETPSVRWEVETPGPSHGVCAVSALWPACSNRLVSPVAWPRWHTCSSERSWCGTFRAHQSLWTYLERISITSLALVKVARLLACPRLIYSDKRQQAEGTGWGDEANYPAHPSFRFLCDVAGFTIWNPGT